MNQLLRPLVTLFTLCDDSRVERATMSKKRECAEYPPHEPEARKRMRYDGGSPMSVNTGKSCQASPNDSSECLPPLPPIDTALAASVFTHSSILSHEEKRSRSGCYERLEFLGDAYIELMATRLIWDKFKDSPAGRLSQIRELLVKNETLSEMAVKYGLEKRIQARADVKGNEGKWTKVKGDVVEAYVAALVLADGEIGGAGFAAAEAWLYPFWSTKLKGVVEEKPSSVDWKVELSRRIVSRGVKLEYLDERPMQQLKGGQETYFIGAFLTGWGYERQLLGRGRGLSKRGAGNLAAEDALRNPLVKSLVEMKRAHDGMVKKQRENGEGQSALDRQDTGEMNGQERLK